MIGAGLVVLIGAGIAAAVTLTGGGSSSGLSTVTSSSTSTPTQTTRTTTSQPVLPDPAVPAARRPALIGAGGALFATSPGGRVARLNGRSLAPARDHVRCLAAARARRARSHAHRRRRQDAVPAAERHARTGRRIGVRAGAARRRWREVSDRRRDRSTRLPRRGVRSRPMRARIVRRDRRGVAPGWHRARGRRCARGAGDVPPLGQEARGEWLRGRRGQAGPRPGRRRGIARLRSRLTGYRRGRSRRTQGDVDDSAAGHARSARRRRRHDRRTAARTRGSGADLERGQADGSQVRRDGPARLRGRGRNRLACLRRECRRRDDHAGRRRQGEGACAAFGSPRSAAPRLLGRSSGAVP